VERRYQGFSLTEALVVLALIAALVVISIPMLVRMLQAYHVKTAATQLAIHMRYARMECVTEKYPYRVVLKSRSAGTGPNTYTIEFNNGSGFQPVSNFDFKLPIGIEIGDTSVFSAGIATILFDSRGGATATAGSPPYLIDIKGVNDVQYRVRLNLTGAVEVIKISG
jgi:Tfp pilus assembly protein FimT